jgi:CRP-like cAMP-binding protein
MRSSPFKMSSFGFLKAFRLCKLFRLVKLLRLKALEDLEDSGAVSPSMIRLGKIIFTFCLLMHMTACMFWLVVRSTCKVCTEETQDLFDVDCGSPYTRTTQPAFTTPDFCPAVWRVQGMEVHTGQMEPPSLTDAYYFSFYWSIMAMLGDNSAPESNMQFMFSIFMSMVGIVVFSTIIGALSALLSSMDKLGEAKQEQLDSINQYMTFRRVSKPLQLRIRAYYKYIWESGQSGHHKSMFDELPPSLRFHLTMSLKEELVVNVPLFRRCPAQTVLEIIKLLESVVAIPEEAVIKEGVKTARMYFCLRGKLQVVVNIEYGQEGQVSTLSNGDFFGETSMFNPNAAAIATVRAIIHSEMEMLSFDELRKLMLVDPFLMKEIKEAARSNFVQMKTKVGTAKSFSISKSAANVRKALARKYKKDEAKLDMVTLLYAAASGRPAEPAPKKVYSRQTSPNALRGDYRAETGRSHR